MTTKKSIILSVATALTMGAKYQNNEAAMAAMADMDAAFGNKVISMAAMPMPAEIEALLMQETSICTSKRK